LEHIHSWLRWPTFTDTPILNDTGSSSTLETSPDIAETALIAGYALRDSGAGIAAESSFRAAISAAPANGEARGALADLLAELDRWGEAAGEYRIAAELEPFRTDWQYGLACALERTGDHAAAQDVWNALLARRPDNAMAHRALARIHVAAARHGQAMEHFREALFLDPGDADTAVELADALIASGDPLAAVETLQPLLRRSPGLSAGLLALGRAWLDLGERGKATDALNRCLMAGPADPSAIQALIDRIEGDPTETMSQAYVKALFDRYADRFDEDLTIRLKYQAPQVLRALVDQLPGMVPVALDVLDVGCGTGLAGVAFRSLARRLHGSDLAPRMVEKARRRGVYDHVEVAELVEGISRTPRAWDLVVAADVLVYVGELAPVMNAAAVGLRSGGLFCATVEQCGGDGFALGPARRYGHSAAYIRRAAAEAGLEILVIEDAVPRWEKGQPVPGFAFVVRAP
jgi:predicted TPR repeat methyltransferase